MLDNTSPPFTDVESFAKQVKAARDSGAVEIYKASKKKPLIPARPEGLAKSQIVELALQKFRELIASPRGTRITALVLPAVLADILNYHNAGNSAIQWKSVGAYQNHMAEASWTYTSDPMIVCTDGNLGGGQHRAIAGVLANAAFYTDITFGHPHEEIAATRNAGKRDKPKDYLQTAGYPNSDVLGRTIRWIKLIEASAGRKPSRETYTPMDYPALAKTMDDKSLTHCVATAITITKMVPQVIKPYNAAVYYLARQQNKTAADELWGDWAEGKPPKIAIKAQKRLITVRSSVMSAKSGNKSGNDWPQVATLLLMWANYSTKGKRASAKSLLWSEDNDVPDVF
jgi:hypothetical protein